MIYKIRRHIIYVISQKCPTGVQNGEYVRTSGGQLSCNAIYHCACEKYHSGQGVAVRKHYIALF